MFFLIADLSSTLFELKTDKTASLADIEDIANRHTHTR